MGSLWASPRLAWQRLARALQLPPQNHPTPPLFRGVSRPRGRHWGGSLGGHVPAQRFKPEALAGHNSWSCRGTSACLSRGRAGVGGVSHARGCGSCYGMKGREMRGHATHRATGGEGAREGRGCWRGVRARVTRGACGWKAREVEVEAACVRARTSAPSGVVVRCSRAACPLRVPCALRGVQ